MLSCEKKKPSAQQLGAQFSTIGEIEDELKSFRDEEVYNLEDILSKQTCTISKSGLKQI